MNIKTMRCLSFCCLNFHGSPLNLPTVDTLDTFWILLSLYSLVIHLISIKLFLMPSLHLDSSSKITILSIYLLFVYRCILNGDVRSSISELLWEKALSIIQKRSNFTEEEIAHLHLNYKSLKSAEDILNRAKVILKSYSDQVASSGITKQLKKVNIKEHDVFLKALFSFSPTKNLNTSYDYPIFVGTFQEIPGFFVMED